VRKIVRGLFVSKESGDIGAREVVLFELIDDLFSLAARCSDAEYGFL
jgi:hypothetical protein